VRERTRLSRLFAEWVDTDPDWERIGPARSGTVVFRLRPRAWASDDSRLGDLNERLLESVRASGDALVSHAGVPGGSALRLAIGSRRTAERDVRRTWEILRAEALRLGALPVTLARP
jgi:hypothetical protein